MKRTYCLFLLTNVVIFYIGNTKDLKNNNKSSVLEPNPTDPTSATAAVC